MTFYDVLGVRADAAEEDVRRAYLARARQHHPDTGGDPARMTAVNEAWSILSDPVQRRRYDRELGLDGGPEPRVWVAPEPDDVAEHDLLDDRPMTAARAPGFLPLLPPGLFLCSVAVGCVALALDAPFVLGAAGTLFLLSCVAVAAVALLTLRGSVRR